MMTKILVATALLFGLVTGAQAVPVDSAKGAVVHGASASGCAVALVPPGSTCTEDEFGNIIISEEQLDRGLTQTDGVGLDHVSDKTILCSLGVGPGCINRLTERETGIFDLPVLRMQIPA